LSQRVSPFGFQKQQDGKPDEYGDSLCIDNLFERTFKCWTASAAEYEPRHIELDPCPLPADVKEPTQQRLQAVTVIHCDGSRAPVKYGIALGWNATCGQLKEGIKKQCQIPEGQQVTLVLLYRNLYTRQAHNIYMHVTGIGAMASAYSSCFPTNRLLQFILHEATSPVHCLICSGLQNSTEALPLFVGKQS